MNTKSTGSVTRKLNELYLKTDENTASDSSGFIEYQPLVPAVNFSSAYQYLDEESLEYYHSQKFNHHRYSRDSNPLVSQTERIFSYLLDRPTLLFSSGMSAIWAALWVSAPRVDAFVSIGGFYRKTLVLIEELSKLSSKPHINVDDVDDAISHNLPSRIIVHVESPCNPMLRIHDIEKLRSAYPDAIIIYDNTFSGLENDLVNLQLVDFQVSSCTKYIGGHNDVICGQVSTTQKDDFSKIWNVRSSQGGIPDSMSAYLLFRSLKTYDARLSNMVSNATRVLEWLDKHPKVKTIHYPGQYANADQANMFARCYRHGGSVISFEVEHGATINLDRAHLFSTKMAPSFGSTDTLIERPSSMSHAGKTDAQLQDLGISRDLVRMSVGMEPVDFILEDLERVLS